MTTTATSSPPDTATIARVQRRAVTVLSGAQVLVGLAVAGSVAAGGLIAAGVAGSEGAAGLAQTCGVLGAAIAALPLARLTLGWGRRPALAAGYGAGAVGALLVVIGAQTRLLALVYLGCLLVGAASAAGLQARYGAMDLAPPARAARSMSVVVWASTIGSVIGPNLLQPSGAIAAALGLPRLTGPYLLAVAALAAAGLLISLALRPDPSLLARRLAESQSPDHLPGVQSTPPREPLRVLLRDALLLVRRRSSSLVGLSGVAVGHVAMVAVMVMTPVHMAHVDVSLTLIGLVISVHVAGMYALSPLVGASADRFGRIPVLGAGVLLLLAACALAGTAAPDDVVQLGVGLFLLGLGWSCTLIAGSTMLSEGITAAQRPGVQGLSDLTMNVAGAGGGVIAGLLVAFGSYGWLCAVTAIPVVCLGGALVREQLNERTLASRA